MRSAFGVAALVAALCTSVFAPRAEAQNTAVGVFYGDRSFSGSITTTTCASNSGTGCLCVGAPGAATLAITSTGTWTGTIGFKTLAADGATQLTVKAFPSGGGAGVTSFTSNGTWYLPIAGTNGACVVASSLSGGTAVINMQASGMPLYSQILPGAEAGGTVTLGAGSAAVGTVTLGAGSAAVGTATAVGAAADGAAASGNPVATSGLGFNGIAKAPRYCDKAIAFTTLSTTATVEQIPAVASQQIYICGWQLFGSTATTGVDLVWKRGTGSNCATGTNSIGGKFLTTPTAATTTPNSVWGPGAVGQQFTVTAGEALCINQSSTSNATTLAGTIFYTQTP